MADSFLYGFAGDILKRVASVVEKEIVLAVGVKKDLIDFETTLTTIKAGILDAEKRADKSRQLQDWLRRLNDVCYDAEDMLDEFEYETLRQPVVADQVSVTMKVCKFFSNTNPRFRSKMGHKLLNIKKRLDEIANDKNKFGLTKRDEDGHTVLTDRETDSSMPSSEVIGRRDDIETIIELLTRTSDEENVSVIPIFGMPGQGKTTLAKMLCNDKRVADHFEKIIWVWVSQDFNIKNIVNRIISACDKDCGDLKYKDQQTKHLQKTLQNKLYLIVLDDVWEIDKGKWVDLKNLLMGGASGSKIIVTTRDLLVAQNVCSKVGYIHQLGCLPDPECLSLFVNWAFKKGEAEQFPRQLEIGKEIVNKCGGLPLAVRTLGIILSETRELKDWLEVKNSEIRKLEHGGNDVSPTLKLSYDRLPSHLQKCLPFVQFSQKIINLLVLS